MNSLANEILLFTDVVKEKSFSKAAKKNNLTPAAVSKKISRLEQSLSVKLFDRSTRILKLTESGNALFERSKNFAEELAAACSAALDSSGELRGTLRILAPTNFCHLVLSPLLVSFSQQYPNIDFHVSLNNDRNIPDLGEYDLIIHAGQLPDSSRFCKLLYQLKFIICASPAYFQQHGKPMFAEELQHHNCIDYDFRQAGRCWTVYQDGEAIQVPIDGQIKSNCGLFIKHTALQGVGIACLPDFMVQQEIDAGLLLPVLENYQAQEMLVHMLFAHRLKDLPRRTAFFIEYLSVMLKKYGTHAIRQMIATI